MAVVHVKEVTDRETSRDKNGNKRYVRTFQVLCDAATDGARIVLEAVGIPAYGDTWEDTLAGDADLDAFVVDKRASQNDRENFQNWTVTVSYAGRTDPVSEPPEVSWATVKYQVAYQEDNDTPAKKVVNSAGDPYEGGLLRDRARLVVTIRKNVLPAAWEGIDPTDYIDTTNELPYLATRFDAPNGVLPGLAKLSDLSADAVWIEDRSDVHFYRRTSKVEIDAYGWTQKVLDAGFNFLMPGGLWGFDKVPIILPAGGRPSSPYPLDGSGAPLGVGGTPVFNTFVPHPSKDWTVIDVEY
jgi:hypothetical protein